jgi:hypothetical protein
MMPRESSTDHLQPQGRRIIVIANFEICKRPGNHFISHPSTTSASDILAQARAQSNKLT